MQQEFVSDKRITDHTGSAIIGKTIARSIFNGSEVFIAFDDGAFVYGYASAHMDDQSEIDFAAQITMEEACEFCLISQAEYAEWKAEYVAYWAAERAAMPQGPPPPVHVGCGCYPRIVSSDVMNGAFEIRTADGSTVTYALKDPDAIDAPLDAECHSGCPCHASRPVRPDDRVVFHVQGQVIPILRSPETGNVVANTITVPLLPDEADGESWRDRPTLL